MAPRDRRLAETLVRFRSAEDRDQRHRDRYRDHEGAARAAQEQDQHQEHQADALDDGAAHLAHGGVHQIVAIDVRNDAHAVLGQFAR